MRGWRIFRLFVLGLFAAVLLFCGISTFFAWRFTGSQRRALHDTAQRFLHSYEDVTFAAADGILLSGWFAPAPGAKQAVVLLHGYGSERTQMLARAGLLQARGFAVLLYDARGHGQSGGDRVSFGWIERRDLTGALDYLRKRGFHEFGCIGASQGGATIVLAAPELRDVRWVVLESVYPTLIDAVDCRFRHSFGLPGWLLGCVMTPLAAQRLGVSCDAIAPLDHIRELPCPVLIMHGDADRHTLIASARAMFSRAAEPKSLWIVPGAAHIDLYGFAPDAYAKQLFGFLDRNQIR